MVPVSLQQLIDQTFTEDICRDLADAMHKSYRANLKSHNPDAGHDAVSFGFVNYKSRAYFLKQLHDPARGIYVIEHKKFLLIQIGEFQVSVYNAGDSTSTDFSRAFPRNRYRAPKIAVLNAVQLKLPLGVDDEEQADDSACRQLILCEVGDAIRGITGVFLAAPVKNSKGRIARWSRIKAIWERGNEEPVLVPETPREPIAPIEKAVGPKPKLKQIPKAENQ